MSYILFEEKGSIGKITLNNPSQLNAILPEMGDELQTLVPKINANSKLRVILLTGTGRAFSAGGNLQFILDHTGKDLSQNKKEMIQFYSKFLSIRKIEVPTLAVINGPAMGAGFCLALACDLRIAAQEARMGLNFSKLGLSSGMGTLFFLSQLVGPAIAADLLFTGRSLEASEAHALGLLNKICPAESLESTAHQIAEQISKNSPLAIKIMKKGIQKTSSVSLEEIFDYESEGQAQSFLTEDLKEGVRAIQEKRKPTFLGE